MKLNEIEKIVNKIRSECYSIDPFIICSMKDYQIVKMNMPKKLRGYTTTKKRIKIIYINNIFSEEIQRQTCAHELGHIECLHKDNIAYASTNTLFVTDREENDANLFLLTLFLSEYNPLELSGLTKGQIANLIGVEEKLMHLL